MPNFGRRDFLKSLGGGLLVLLTADHEIAAQESGQRALSHELPNNVAAWLHIAPDGKITAFTGKVEVGQNIRTSLTQAVADELRVSPNAVTLVMGDTNLDTLGHGNIRQPNHAHDGSRNAQDGGHGAREALTAKRPQKTGMAKDHLHVERVHCYGDVEGGDAPMVIWRRRSIG